MFFFRIVAFLFVSCSSCYSVEQANLLLPGIGSSFSVNFALPKGTSLASRLDPPDIVNGVFWGSSKTLQSYLAGDLPIKGPMIAVKLSNDVKQKGPMEFETSVAMSKSLKGIGGSSLKVKKMHWGPYPVLVIDVVARSGTEYHVAFAGLNDDEGTTLMFTYLVPSAKNRPTDSQWSIWQRFLQESESS